MQENAPFKISRGDVHGAPSGPQSHPNDLPKYWLAIGLPQQFLSAYLSTTEAFTSKSFLGNL